ncbi:MAG: phosphate ABC transporter permease subunit PstC [Pseudomonadales bacterium]|nr:phosphate ABC transporter permease subunit PstC [Pseudomonadales bacterium]
MGPGTLLIVIFACALAGFYQGSSRAATVAAAHGGVRALPALPSHYGTFVALMAVLPALLVMALWLLLDGIYIERLLLDALPAPLLEQDHGLLLNSISILAAAPARVSADPVLAAAALRLLELRRQSELGLALCACATAVIGAVLAWRCISVRFAARVVVERIFTRLLLLCAAMAVVTTLGIFLSVIFESLRFFQMVSPMEFFFGLEWSPQIALRADQQGSSGRFGALPLFAGTLLISVIALIVAVPIGLMSAIYLSEYASNRLRRRLKPLLEILAGIPTVVYGFFAALTVAPLIRDLGGALGLAASSESALAAGLVMGIMIIPFVSSLSDDIIHAVPHGMRDGSLALGATRSETIKRVVIPAALPGIVGGILLAASRAIGETMIVVMAAGLSAHLTANPFESVTTVTVQIVTLLVGDQEFDSPKTLAAFALGLVLFLVTLGLNIFALHIVRKYREQYE